MELSFKERFLMAEFKASAIYESIDDICELNLLTDLPNKLCEEGRNRFGVFSGNCVVVETTMLSKQETRYFTYVFDPLGYPTIIPESAKHSRTKDDAITWLESDDFRANKTLYIAAATLQPHEYEEDIVFTVCKGFVQDPLFRRHRKFRLEFGAWLAEQVDDEGQSIF